MLHGVARCQFAPLSHSLVHTNGLSSTVVVAIPTGRRHVY